MGTEVTEQLRCQTCCKTIEHDQNYFIGHDQQYWHFGCLDVLRDGREVTGFGRMFIGNLIVNKPKVLVKFNKPEEP